MDLYTRLDDAQRPTRENYKVTAVVSLSRVNHRFGPKSFDHGTLMFVQEGRIFIDLRETGIRETVGKDHFIWLPPGLVRTTSTDARGADMHALLLEKVIDHDHLLPYVRMPDRPSISIARHPTRVATLFKSAEQQWVESKHGESSVAAHGFSLLILAKWLEDLKETDASPHMESVVQTVVQHIAANHDRPELSVDELCAITPWSRRYFFRAFKQVTGMTPQGYLQQTRLNRAIDLLRMGELRVGDVARRCGFQDAAYFSRLFTRQVGHPPSALRGTRVGSIRLSSGWR